jgi:hypothetical protein
MTSVYHAGELIVQKMAGAEVEAMQNGRSIKTSIPKGAIALPDGLRSYGTKK